MGLSFVIEEKRDLTVSLMPRNCLPYRSVNSVVFLFDSEAPMPNDRDRCGIPFVTSVPQ